MRSNQLKIGVVLSYISIALNMLIQLIYTPIMIRLLGQSEYGLYTLVGSVVSYLGLFSLGFVGAYLRFFSRYHVKNDRDGIARLNGMFITLFFCLSSIALICGLILSQFTSQLFGTSLMPEELVKAKILMQILVVNIALTFPASIFASMISAHEKFLFQRLIQLASIVFNPLICLPLLLLGYGSVAMVATTTGITLAKLCVNVWYCIYKLKIPISFKKFNWSLMKEMSGFSFFIFLNMIIDQLNWSVDKFILGRIAGTREVAIYGVGTQFNSILMTLTTIISNVFAPRVNKISAAHDEGYNQELSKLLVRVGRLQYMIILFVFIGFVSFGKIFINLWVGNGYASAYYVALLLIAPLIIVLPHSLGVEIRRAKNKHQMATFIIFISTIANVIISIPLASYFGAIGAATGTFLCLLINMIWLDFYYIHRIHIDIKLLYKNLFSITKAVIIPVIFGLCGVAIYNELLNIVWTVLYVVFYIILLYKFGLNIEEKKLIFNVVKKIKQGFSHIKEK